MSDSSQSLPPPAPTPWGLVILLGAMTAFAPMSIDMYLPAQTAIVGALKASQSQVELTLSTFLAGMAIGQFFYGSASDRFGRRIPILIGCGVYIVASVICALSNDINALIAARFLQALGGCAGGVVARAIVRDNFDHRDTARILSLLMLVMGLAPILAPAAGSLVLQIASWRAIFWCLAGFGILVALAVAFRLPESRSEETAAQARSENPFQAYLALLAQPKLIGYLLAGALNGAVLFTYISASPGLIMGIYGVGPVAYAWLFGLNAVGIIGANQVNRMLLRTYSPDAVLKAASTAGIVFGLLLLIASVTGIGGPWTVLPLLFVTLTTYALMAGNTTAGALNCDPRRAGSISALSGGLSFGAGAVASALGGLMHNGTPVPMAAVMLACLIGSALSLRLLALSRQGPL
ncbi:multidrug effflux MFS transporter [Caulobacter sp. NIBR1757]|uniref:multidrug effflux MFS transporter n=1 Tax=Caulobacter sp. NIBR1757 TaxID=3016000 RepID=UPI0022EFF2C9|nr:multidrug effflux MFS transporter [Caulobacter sp. NIBR1757]WGM38926.1 Bicyclomycin resistance protein [Caulobacter sp. NIBR1757]